LTCYCLLALTCTFRCLLYFLFHSEFSHAILKANIYGQEAKRIGLVCDSVPDHMLDDTVLKLAAQIAAVPKNQLLMSKLVIFYVLNFLFLYFFIYLSILIILN
jgi:hypothetical protein